VAKRTRPECLAAVAFLATRVTMSDEDDMEKLMRLLGYMLATPHRGIAFKIGKFMSLNAFIDAASTIHCEIVWLNPKLTNNPPPPNTDSDFKSGFDGEIYGSVAVSRYGSGVLQHVLLSSSLVSCLSNELSVCSIFTFSNH
jgi:hypothetical protein